jgi:hypothetical protein
MNSKDVKIGDKVVPHDKTPQGFCGDATHGNDWKGFCNGNNQHKERFNFFKENGFLYVSNIYHGSNIVCLSYDGKTAGSTFRASDFNPYVETPQDNSIKKHVIMGNRTIVYLAGLRKGIATCSPADTFLPVKGLAIAYARALGQKVEDIKIEINPCASACKVVEDKPTFEVGDRVKFREDLNEGWQYDGMTFTYSMKTNLPKTFALPEIDEVNNCHINGWHFSLAMLEKIPQPAKHEIFVDGVKYVRCENGNQTF